MLSNEDSNVRTFNYSRETVTEAVGQECTAYPQDCIDVQAAEGLWITGNDGVKYLDACAGTFNVGLGFKHPEVVGVLNEVINTGLLHGSTTLSSPFVRNAERALVSIAPKNMNCCHLKGCTGGSTAIEQSIRHHWATSEQKGIVSFRNSHHGQTIAATLISGMGFRKKRLYGGLTTTINIPAPDCYWCPMKESPDKCRLQCTGFVADAIKRARDSGEEIGAMIAEPILGAGGGDFPPADYWATVSSTLRKANVKLIMDEVQTFGRCGEFLASGLVGAVPDMIALGKSISGIGVPAAGALLLPKHLAVLSAGETSLTWGGANLTAAAIVATIRVMNLPCFFPNVKYVGEKLREHLSRLLIDYDEVGCIRGINLMTGFEVVNSKAGRSPNPSLATAIIREARMNGLLLRQSQYGYGAFVKIRPALIATESEVDEIFSRLRFSMNRLLGLHRENRI